MVHEIIKYVYKHNQKKAVMIANKRADGGVSIGYAMQHPNDVFSKKRGLALARNRANAWIDRDIDHVAIPETLIPVLTEFADRCETKFGIDNIPLWARELSAGVLL